MIAADTIEASSPGLDRRGIEYVVTLPTFRRPEHLLRTLASVKTQAMRGPMAVLVMENDAERREGLEAARSLFETGEIAGHILVVPERGNCNAYNSGWRSALAEFPNARFIIVIDDDELAAPGWAQALVDTAEVLPADLVGGPQVPVFEGENGEHYRRHPVFTPHYAETGRVPILYSSGNVAIRRDVLEAMPFPFLDPMFNFLGGGDSDFYSRCRLRGFRFGWCAEARVDETTPARRTEFSWVNARALRNGAISTIIEQRRATTAAGRVKSLAKSVALLAASPLRGAALAARSRSAVIGLYPVQVALGRLQGHLGGANEQYRRPEGN
ncbi:glycosyltransferase family 2 protein [Aureimonas mangrovi]|uniref:glycosyltransferase family 2 protein n=1 Tax=Aureimonas mangrovi TaxID=2758041 RepID=UPI00163DC375|nr:glycosyltransferase [Aureimonas mangrovi]